MAIEKKAFKALESAVGADNVSQDPTILASYNRAPLGVTKLDEFLPFPPIAVVLPASTEDVQNVVIYVTDIISNTRRIARDSWTLRWRVWTMWCRLIFDE